MVIWGWGEEMTWTLCWGVFMLLLPTLAKVFFCLEKNKLQLSLIPLWTVVPGAQYVHVTPRTLSHPNHIHQSRPASHDHVPFNFSTRRKWSSCVSVCFFQDLNFLKQVPRITLMSSRHLSVSWISSVTRCLRAWRQIQPSLPQSRTQDSRKRLLRRSPAVAASVPEQAAPEGLVAKNSIYKWLISLHLYCLITIWGKSLLSVARTCIQFWGESLC